jgi:hypothetical protein
MNDPGEPPFTKHKRYYLFFKMMSSNLRSFWAFILSSALGALAVFYYYSHFHIKWLSNYPDHSRLNVEPFGSAALIFSSLLTPPLIILIRLIYTMRADIIKQGFPSIHELTLGILLGFVAPWATIGGTPAPIVFLLFLITGIVGPSFVLIFVLQCLLFLMPNLIVLRAVSLQKAKHKNPEDAWKPIAYIIAYFWIIWCGSSLFLGWFWV